MTETPNSAMKMAPDTEAPEKAVWVKPVVEDFNTQIEGGSINGASDVSVFTS